MRDILKIIKLTLAWLTVAIVALLMANAKSGYSVPPVVNICAVLFMGIVAVLYVCAVQTVEYKKMYESCKQTNARLKIAGGKRK
uniref:Uncharacterized protein n=1 Tax=Magnetococcus massalia (strain MO-1) TaxID=451514 RepID=A0A1S7LN11_MAGMO|nr:exported protein of unknown function [Candidatus Magnetococcus massalia]